MQRFIPLGMATALAVASLAPLTVAAADNRFSAHVDSSGQISLPKDFRSTWTHLGSWVVQQDGAPGQGFHDVYTEPTSAAAFRKTGQWPDGATLVKEIRSIRSGALTTGPGLWAGDNKVWFVMIKDSKGRFRSQEKTKGNWGDGWGWALFDAKDPSKNLSASHEKDCKGCHLPAQATDWVFVEGYPTLRR
ncbi:cytochrome P460 family protein [Nevskia sp.]|uniref:cytochrome P460 family protein n=1 Tax=Nevskia sp. TaxID=1929292 RepID=UPI0025CBD852|nr:cytochrome P460 family protein [Nevskia sp.]